MRFVIHTLMIAALLCGCSSDDNGGPKPDRGATTDSGTTADGGVTPDTGTAGDTGGGDGGSAAKVETYVPADNDVAGWVEDDSAGKPGVEAAYTDKDIFDIIDGHHQPYADEGTVGFAKQDYKKGASILALEIWEMNGAVSAKKMFDMNKKEGEDNSGLTFEAIPDVLEAGIIAKDTPQWRAYGHKGPYIYQLVATFSNPADADGLKTETIAFAKHLAGKLP